MSDQKTVDELDLMQAFKANGKLYRATGVTEGLGPDYEWVVDYGDEGGVAKVPVGVVPLGTNVPCFPLGHDDVIYDDGESA